MERSTPFPPARRISSRCSMGVRGRGGVLELDTEELDDGTSEEEENSGKGNGITTSPED